MDQTLANIFVEVMSGTHCSHIDLEYVLGECWSNNCLRRIKALGIVLAIGNENQKARAIGTLEEMLNVGEIRTVESEFALIVVLLQLRKSLTFSLPFRDFVICASKSTSPELRCNAAIILADIAGYDAAAKNALERLANDKDESVRHNAITVLAWI